MVYLGETQGTIFLKPFKGKQSCPTWHQHVDTRFCNKTSRKNF